jgi:hypothetical protein
MPKKTITACFVLMGILSCAVTAQEHMNLYPGGG